MTWRTANLPRTLDGTHPAIILGVLGSVIAAVTTYLAQHYCATTMSFALLLGIAMTFLSADAHVPRVSCSEHATCCASG